MIGAPMTMDMSSRAAHLTIVVHVAWIHAQSIVNLHNVLISEYKQVRDVHNSQLRTD